MTKQDYIALLDTAIAMIDEISKNWDNIFNVSKKD